MFAKVAELGHTRAMYRALLAVGTLVRWNALPIFLQLLAYACFFSVAARFGPVWHLLYWVSLLLTGACLTVRHATFIAQHSTA